MSTLLREAARAALEQRARPVPNDATLTRAVFEVRVADRTELVSVSLRDGELYCITSDGRTEGPEVTEVLRLLSGEVHVPAASSRGAVVRGNVVATSSESERLSSAPPPPRTAEAVDGFGEALLDLVTAVVRVGLADAGKSPSVDAAVERLVEASPTPLPVGLDRFLARLRRALVNCDSTLAARLLTEAARLGTTFREDTVEARRRRASLCGGSDRRDLDHITNCKLVEVGREWLVGRKRSGIERRYLVDARSGVVYCEERERAGPGVSVGPCPRFVSVGLAEVQRGPAPRRIRLHQYAVSAHIASGTWTRIVNGAATDFESVAQQYREALREFPGQAEPVVLIRPARCETGNNVVPYDHENRPLPIATARDPGAASALEQILQEGDLAWLAGRLIDIAGHLLLVPVSVGIHRHGQLSVRRLR